MMFGQLSKEAALNQWLHILHPSREQLAQPVQQALLEQTELTAQQAQPVQLVLLELTAQLAQPVQQALLEPTELTAQLVQPVQLVQLARKVFKVSKV